MKKKTIIAIGIILSIIIALVVIKKENFFTKQDINLEKHKAGSDAEASLNNDIIIVENGVDIQTSTLFENLLGVGEDFHIGKRYEEKLCVKNNSEFEVYVRVLIYKDWIVYENQKNRNLSSDLINLNLVNVRFWK